MVTLLFRLIIVCFLQRMIKICFVKLLFMMDVLLLENAGNSPVVRQPK